METIIFGIVCGFSGGITSLVLFVTLKIRVTVTVEDKTKDEDFSSN